MAEQPPRRGFIRCYGLFWRRQEVIWSRADGSGAYRLLGRLGTNAPKVQVCDFRAQRGIYVLYDDYGSYYVGLARNQAIGNRLRTHTRDVHADRWDRFSWFGFMQVLKRPLPDGTRDLGAPPHRLLTNSHWTIGDMEALLIQALGTQHRGNLQTMKFAAAQMWTQVMRDEVETYFAKVSR